LDLEGWLPKIENAPCANAGDAPLERFSGSCVGGTLGTTNFRRCTRFRMELQNSAGIELTSHPSPIRATLLTTLPVLYAAPDLNEFGRYAELRVFGEDPAEGSVPADVGEEGEVALAGFPGAASGGPLDRQAVDLRITIIRKWLRRVMCSSTWAVVQPQSSGR